MKEKNRRKERTEEGNSNVEKKKERKHEGIKEIEQEVGKIHPNLDFSYIHSASQITLRLGQ